MAIGSSKYVAFISHWLGAWVKVTGRGKVVSGKTGQGINIALLFCIFFLLSFANISHSSDVGERIHTFDIPRQNAGAALTALGQQADISVLYRYETVSKIESNRLKGGYRLARALDILLKNSGLAYRFEKNGHLIITTNNEMGKGIMNSKKNILAVAVGTFLSGGLAAEDAGDAELGWLLEEIVVTATKRESSLQDTPMSISVISSDIIDKKGLVSMQDYLSTLPGVTMQDRGAGHNTVIIRGIGSDPQTEIPATGIYFGEVPLTGLGGASAINRSGNGNIRLVDIERVEVLRGPQGTLYGGGSLAGTVRVVPTRPNLEGLGGKLEAGYSSTSGTGGDNNMVQGAINIPLIEDKLAIRAVGYRFDDSGYIENVAASQPNAAMNFAINNLGAVAVDRDEVGGSEVVGFRFHALWQLAENLQVDLMHIQQDVEQDGKLQVNLLLDGNYQQTRLRGGYGGTKDEFDENDVEISNIVINYDFGWAELTSASSWVAQDSAGQIDFSTFQGGLPLAVGTEMDNEQFIQELRLASNLDGPFQFLVGAYLQDQEQERSAINRWSGDVALAPGPFAGLDPLSITGTLTDIKQKAFFTELTYSLTDELTVTAGGRHYDYDQKLTRRLTRSGLEQDPIVYPEVNDKGETYKLNLSYNNDDGTLVYGTWTEGFRQGRPLGLPTLPDACDVAPEDGILDDIGISSPTQLESDSTENFEIGLKTSLMDNRITFNASVYRTDWDGIPVSVVLPTCGRSVSLNAGEARSEGVEIDVQLLLAESLKMDFSASYNDSILTEDAENIGNKGDNLPGSADYNASVGLEYAFTMVGYDAFARADYSYVGEYYNNTAEVGEAAGDYHQINLKVGANFNNIGVDLYVRNLTDADEFTWVDSQLAGLRGGFAEGYRLRPRTVGLNIKYLF